MTVEELNQRLSKHFDVVGIINTSRYLEEARKMNKIVPDEIYPTMVVVGLAYPMRIIKHTSTHLVPSFYTFGSDYHLSMKNRIDHVMQEIGLPYKLGVDNHPHDERLAAVLAGIGFFGKNQLIINQTLGSYFFLGIILIDHTFNHEFMLDVTDDCGTCRKCIDACPTHALEEGIYHMDKCMSHYNQEKRILNEDEILANYALFGCDICQMVCPKNINKGKKMHPEFEISGKEMVSIVDLFTDSEKTFREKYQDMSYLWKGKTILMRNAAMLLLRHKNTQYNDLIEKTLEKHETTWYKDTVDPILNQLKQLKKESSNT